MNLELFLYAITSYIVIIDPLGAALLFNSLTGEGDKKYVRKMAVKTVIIAICILLASGFFGQALFAKLGITIDALKVSGGLLLFYTAFKMITSLQGTVSKKEGAGVEHKKVAGRPAGGPV